MLLKFDCKLMKLLECVHCNLFQCLLYYSQFFYVPVAAIKVKYSAVELRIATSFLYPLSFDIVSFFYFNPFVKTLFTTELSSTHNYESAPTAITNRRERVGQFAPEYSITRQWISIISKLL